MSINWGGFGGGFAQGFQNGVTIGKTVGDAIKQKKIDDIRQKGLEEAQAASQAAIEKSVVDTGAAQAKGGMPSKAADESAKAPAPARVDAAPLAPVGMEAGQANPAAPTATVPDASAVPSPQTSPVPQPQVAVRNLQPGQKVTADGTVYTPTFEGDPGPDPRSGTAQAAPAQPAAQPEQGDATSAAPLAVPDQPAAQLGVGKRFRVGDQSFDTREEAVAFAKKNAPDPMTYFAKSVVPKLQEEYIAQGDVAKADAFGKWAQERETQQHMKDWSEAYKAMQIGDIDRAANHIFKLYKSYDDGVTPMSKETVKDKDGNITGFNIRLKNDQTGEETTTFIDRDRLVNMGLSALSPPQMFEQVWKKQATIDANKQALAKEDRIAAREDKRLVYKEDRADKREVAKGQREADRDARRAEREADNIELKARLEQQFKKVTDPTERRAIVTTELIKSDPSFSRKSPAEKAKAVDDVMATIYPNGEGQSPKPAPAPANPAAGGMPAQPGAKAAPATNVPSSYVKDVKTGEIYQVMPDGRRVPTGKKMAP